MKDNGKEICEYDDWENNLVLLNMGGENQIFNILKHRHICDVSEVK
ncbi:hypothetical protein [Photorhabdus africana]|nr:hypothetical protein [Photorhabdus sp. CRI-LC]